MPSRTNERLTPSELSTVHSVRDGDLAGEPLERHYSPEEVAGLWCLSSRTIRRLFGKEPGIIEVGTIGSLKKRRYMTIRIPESVLNRVHRRLRKAG